MKLDNNNIIEIYKELGVYERHFNQSQNLFKGLASTWFFFLAGFTGIGYIYSSNILELPTKNELAACLICLVISTGIMLFWMMDVLVYHKLLRATVDTAQSFKLNKSSKHFVELRENWKNYTKILNIRTAISLFYVIPCLILVFGGVYFLIQVWYNNTWYNNVIIVAWLSLIILGTILIMTFQKRKK